MKHTNSLNISNISINAGFCLVMVEIILLSLNSCNKNNEVTGSSQIILEGYLFQGETVDSIHLTKTVTFESTDTIYPPVSDAQVVITWNGKSYALQSIGNGYYNCNDSSLEIKTGGTYAIAVTYNGKTATSSTVVPVMPASVQLSDNVVYVDTTFSFGGPGMIDSSGSGSGTNLEITWDNTDNGYYYVVIESTDPDAAGIVEGTGNFPGGGMKPGSTFRFRSQPFHGSSYTITSGSLEKYGKHAAKIYRVNQEYADLYLNRQQDSRNLSEPITNVVNGLGIFTSFSYTEVSFNVVNAIYKPK